MSNPYQPPTQQPGFGAAGGQQGWGPPAQPGAVGGQYEFDMLENDIISKAGRRSHLWGIFSIVIGVLYLLLGLFLLLGAGMVAASGNTGGLGKVFGAVAGGAAVLMVINAVVYGVMGKLYMDSGNALRAVVTTQGNDIDHIMQAVKKLGSAFQIEGILTIIAFVAGVIIGIVGNV